MKAERMGAVTLVSHFGSVTFPRKQGNVFTVFTDEAENKERAVLNIYAENLEELIKQGGVRFPIEIVPVGTDRATIVDQRIPATWYHS